MGTLSATPLDKLHRVEVAISAFPEVNPELPFGDALLAAARASLTTRRGPIVADESGVS